MEEGAWVSFAIKHFSGCTTSFVTGIIVLYFYTFCGVDSGTRSNFRLLFLDDISSHQKRTRNVKVGLFVKISTMSHSRSLFPTVLGLLSSYTVLVDVKEKKSSLPKHH